MRKTRNYLNRNFNKDRSKDSLTKEERSRLMSKIRSTGTKFERDFIGLLKKSTSKKFSENSNRIKGKPDIVFQKERICIFLDSDFWHGWQYPRWKHLLKNDFWRSKIENNRARDKRNTASLKRIGWNVIRIWEHNLKIKRKETLVNVINILRIG